ncbi:MAG TPA: Gfo/Idh/MocA family oxidoreductase, partial [Propionibacteriaceae bacterium]|nr:Gfo/Idh/MocA family oxidoreductase [Propionibacteriaceae bacterium]
MRCCSGTARLARQAPEHFTVTGIVTRSAERSEVVEREWGARSFRSVAELTSAEQPEFVIPRVPWAQMATTTIECVDQGLRVLAETPPAADLDGLRQLSSRVGQTELVQVAEQYLLMPAHAARRSLLREGVIGDVTSVQVSSTRLYHAVSMIRGMLDVGLGQVRVNAQSFIPPLAN